MDTAFSAFSASVRVSGMDGSELREWLAKLSEDLGACLSGDHPGHAKVVASYPLGKIWMSSTGAEVQSRVLGEPTDSVTEVPVEVVCVRYGSDGDCLLGAWERATDNLRSSACMQIVDAPQVAARQTSLE